MIKKNKIKNDKLQNLVEIYLKKFGDNRFIFGLKNIVNKDLNLKISSSLWFIANLQEWNYNDTEKEFKFKLKKEEKKIFNFRKRIGFIEEKFEFFFDIDE